MRPWVQRHCRLVSVGTPRQGAPQPEVPRTSSRGGTDLAPGADPHASTTMGRSDLFLSPLWQVSLLSACACLWGSYVCPLSLVRVREQKRTARNKAGTAFKRPRRREAAMVAGRARGVAARA